MSSSLPKILETVINVFISNSQIITIKTYYEKSTQSAKKYKIANMENLHLVKMGLKVKTRWTFIQEFQFTVRRQLYNYHKMADYMVTKSNHILRLYSAILYNK